MKKVLFAVLIAIAAFACKEPDQGLTLPEPDKGVSYVLEGVVNTEGFEWSESAIIGLYSMQTEVKAVNLECKIEGYVEPVAPGEDEEAVAPEGGEATPAAYAAEMPANARRFNTPALDLVKGENKFMVYYPYSEDMAYAGGWIYDLNVSASQVQGIANVAADCFSFGVASGTPKVDETFQFTMNPITALAQVKITSTEFADYAVKKVSIWNEDDVTISGAFNVNVETMEFQLYPNETPTRAGVQISTPKLLSEITTQNIYVNLLPCDLTGKDMWLMVEMEGAKGSVTLPVKKEGVKFEAGKTTTIDLSNLSMADNAVGEWYVPTESRLLAGLGYAYGDANCYLIQCKNGSTYNGATYTPNADIPNEVKIDIRPRGDLSKVVDPKGATFEWFKKGAQTAVFGQGTGAVYTARTAGYTASAVDPTAYEVTYDGNYTVTVKNTGAYAGAPILLMIKDGKILWAWSFWNISADCTQLEATKIGDYEFANMLIGQNTTQYETWVANKNGSNPDPVYRFVAYYQWGRHVPSHYWDYYWSVDLGLASVPFEGWMTSASGNVPVWITQPVTLAEALARPVGGIYAPGANVPSWCSEVYTDLWGDTSYSRDKAEVGTKSIYDPCPKGWRVPDVLAADYIDENDASIEYSTLKGAPAAKLGGIYFLSAGYVNRMCYPGETGSGRLSQMGCGQDGSPTGAAKWGAMWSNMAGANQGFMLRHQSDVSLKDCVGMQVGGMNRQAAAPVRCIKDTDNR